MAGEGGSVHSPLGPELDLAQVPVAARRAWAADYQRQRKSAVWAYVLWAAVGAHYVYLGKRRDQRLFVLTLGGLGVWWLLDVVRIPRLVDDANAALRARLAARYQSLSGVSMAAGARPVRAAPAARERLPEATVSAPGPRPGQAAPVPAARRTHSV